jgi:hypothetical protein
MVVVGVFYGVRWIYRVVRRYEAKVEVLPPARIEKY